MPKMYTNSDRTLRSRLGHTIRFKKNEPKYVPPHIEREAFAIGAVRTEDEEPSVFEDEDRSGEDRAAPGQPPSMNAQERQEAILAAIEQIVVRNDSKDFTAAGRPHPESIKDIIGVKVSAKERDVAWDEYQKSQEGGE